MMMVFKPTLLLPIIIAHTFFFLVHVRALSVQTQTPRTPVGTASKSSVGSNINSNNNNISPTSPIVTTGIDIQAWGNAFNNCPQELPPTIVPIDDLPSDFPVGTHYINGHAKFYADDGTPVLHPFDADGMIVAMTFDPVQKRMLFRNKFVETEGYVKDKESGTISERGLFGTMKSGGILNNMFRTSYKHVANTNVIHAGNDLYALWEGGKPYLLDPLTLRNKHDSIGKAGMTNLDGLIDVNFSAHPRYDPERKSYVNFGSAYDPIKSEFKVSLYEVDDTTFRSKQSTVPNFILGAPALLHDFILTKNYCIFNINDTKINVVAAIKALLGFGGFAGSLEVNEAAEHSNIVLIPRSLFNEKQSQVDSINLFEDDRIIVVPVEKHFNFHYSNAFEDEDGHVVFDTVQIQEIDLAPGSEDGKTPVWLKDNPYESVSPSQMMRYTIDVKNKCVALGQPSPRLLTTRLPEFPSIPRDMSTRKHRYIYPVVARKKVNVDPKVMGQGGPFGGIAKIDALDPSNNEYYSFEPYKFPGECVLCPKAGKDSSTAKEDSCYLLTNIVNGRTLTTELAIFDVEGKGSLEKGPIVRCPLPVFIPHMLHGSFAEEVTFDFKPFEA